MCELGPKFGYFSEPTKSWLIVKLNCSDKAIHIPYQHSNNNRHLGKRHLGERHRGKRNLGAALGTSQFRDKNMMEKINKWVEGLHVLSEIARIEPQAAYTCFLSETQTQLLYENNPRHRQTIKKK